MKLEGSLYERRIDYEGYTILFDLEYKPNYGVMAKNIQLFAGGTQLDLTDSIINSELILAQVEKEEAMANLYELQSFADEYEISELEKRAVSND